MAKENKKKLVEHGKLLKFKGFINVVPTSEQFENLSNEELRALTPEQMIRTVEHNGSSFQTMTIRVSKKDKDGNYMNSVNIQTTAVSRVLELMNQQVEVVAESTIGTWKKKKYNRFNAKSIKPLFDYSHVQEDDSMYDIVLNDNTVDDDELPFADLNEEVGNE